MIYEGQTTPLVMRVVGQTPVLSSGNRGFVLSPALTKDNSPVFFIRHNHVRYAFPQHLSLVADNYSNTGNQSA